MRNLYILILLLLSCTAVSAARADVIVTNGATVINNDRFDDDDHDRDIRIYNGDGSYSPDSAFIINDGKFQQLPDGNYDLNGQKVNITNGRMNATFGNQDIDSRVKIIQPRQ